MSNGLKMFLRNIIFNMKSNIYNASKTYENENNKNVQIKSNINETSVKIGSKDIKIPDYNEHKKLLRENQNLQKTVEMLEKQLNSLSQQLSSLNNRVDHITHQVNKNTKDVFSVKSSQDRIFKK